MSYHCQGVVTTANIPSSSSSIQDMDKREDLGPDPNKQGLIFERIHRDLVNWHDHVGACVSGDPGAFPAAAHIVKLFSEVFAELLGEETVDDRV